MPVGGDGGGRGNGGNSLQYGFCRQVGPTEGETGAREERSIFADAERFVGIRNAPAPGSVSLSW